MRSVRRMRRWRRSASRGCSTERTSPTRRSRNDAMLTVTPHPLLDLAAFVSHFPRPLGELATPPEILGLLKIDAAAPLRSDDAVRETVRALLRQGGFKPTGRSKPASEYLIRAAT